MKSECADLPFAPSPSCFVNGVVYGNHWRRRRRRKRRRSGENENRRWLPTTAVERKEEEGEKRKEEGGGGISHWNKTRSGEGGRETKKGPRKKKNRLRKIQKRIHWKNVGCFFFFVFFSQTHVRYYTRLFTACCALLLRVCALHERILGAKQVCLHLSRGRPLPPFLPFLFSFRPFMSSSSSNKPETSAPKLDSNGGKCVCQEAC